MRRTRKRSLLHVVLAALALGTAGCIAVGSADRLYDLRKMVKVGTTTKAEVLERFGKPFNVVERNGFAHWNYKYVNVGLMPGMKAEAKYVVITFPLGSEVASVCEYREDDARHIGVAILPGDTIQRRCDQF